MVNSGRPAYANGAFPDSLQLLLPADRPHEIVLATNFGLISSEDDGQTWLWACEPDQNDNAILYQVGPSPGNRIYAILLRTGLVYSDDGACTWSPAQGSLATAVANDAFADPTNAARVFALAAEPGDGGRTARSVYRSLDGGVTFGAPLFSASAAGDLLSVESAFSDPMTVYMSMYAAPGVNPFLVRSTDGGARWTSLDLAPMLGPNGFRIIAVDRGDPLKLYLRVSQDVGEKLAVSADGGVTFQQPVTVATTLSAFARLASGAVLVAAGANTTPEAFRSTDGGVSFQPWPNPPHLRALGERDGKLFAAADNFRDGFALGVSMDDGANFQPLLTYDQVKAIKPCVQDRCRDTCDNLAGLTLWPPQVCGNARPDAGPPAPPKGGGCGCRAAGQAAAPAPPEIVVALVAALACLRARRRRAKRP
jgi:photosystem II stability/assembly factor-like uncharacterized protein